MAENDDLPTLVGAGVTLRELRPSDAATLFALLWNRTRCSTTNSMGRVAIAAGRGLAVIGRRLYRAIGRSMGPVLPWRRPRGFPAQDNAADLSNSKTTPQQPPFAGRLNLAVNELADVLHTFFLNVVSEED